MSSTIGASRRTGDHYTSARDGVPRRFVDFARRGFRGGPAGNRDAVLGLGIALTLVGLLLGFIAFPFGFLPGLVGLVLILLYVLGLGARAGERS